MMQSQTRRRVCVCVSPSLLRSSPTLIIIIHWPSSSLSFTQHPILFSLTQPTHLTSPSLRHVSPWLSFILIALLSHSIELIQLCLATTPLPPPRIAPVSLSSPPFPPPLSPSPAHSIPIQACQTSLPVQDLGSSPRFNITPDVAQAERPCRRFARSHYQAHRGGERIFGPVSSTCLVSSPRPPFTPSSVFFRREFTPTDVALVCARSLPGARVRPSV